MTGFHYSLFSSVLSTLNKASNKNDNNVNCTFTHLPVRTRGGCSAPAADRRSPWLHVHPTAK